MKNVIKVFSGILVAASVLALNPMKASAAWMQDKNGWWYSEGSSWAKGWENIQGKWYYFDNYGYMVKDKAIDGWYIDETGVGTKCIQVDGFDIVKETGTIVKYNRKDINWGPGKAGIPLEIPKIIGGVEIKSIGNKAFTWCGYLTSVTIPDSVTSIGYSAFESCTGLTSVTMPDSVTSIGNDAFESCGNLKNITMSKNIKDIGQGAFYGCNKLMSITIPDGVTSLNNWVLGDCINLSNVTIPSNLTTIKYWAFGECTSLTSITIPNTVTSIEKGAFEKCINAKFYVKSDTTRQLLINAGVNANNIATTA